jgi:hypothetical protein
VTAEPQDIDLDEVEVWRAEQLRDAGYEEFWAVEFAPRRDIDLHFAVELVEHGCDPALATEIIR